MAGDRRIGCSAALHERASKHATAARGERPITQIWNRDPAAKRSVRRSRGARQGSSGGGAALRVGAADAQARDGSYVMGNGRGPRAEGAAGVRMPVLRGEAANAARAMVNGWARWWCPHEELTTAAGNDRAARGRAMGAVFAMGKWPRSVLRDAEGAACGTDEGCKGSDEGNGRIPATDRGDEERSAGDDERPPRAQRTRVVMAITMVAPKGQAASWAAHAGGAARRPLPAHKQGVGRVGFGRQRGDAFEVKSVAVCGETTKATWAMGNAGVMCCGHRWRRCQRRGRARAGVAHAVGGARRDSRRTRDVGFERCRGMALRTVEVRGADEGDVGSGERQRRVLRVRGGVGWGEGARWRGVESENVRFDSRAAGRARCRGAVAGREKPPAVACVGERWTTQGVRGGRTGGDAAEDGRQSSITRSCCSCGRGARAGRLANADISTCTERGKKGEKEGKKGKEGREGYIWRRKRQRSGERNAPGSRECDDNPNPGGGEGYSSTQARRWPACMAGVVRVSHGRSSTKDTAISIAVELDRKARTPEY
ncbi:hypothetical protein C8R44DRAFT_860204 [Mycena epipterygia]|nr:hypothetical protein C8R44DRAFT_860204 [Mycena epipterygia]